MKRTMTVVGLLAVLSVVATVLSYPLSAAPIQSPATYQAVSTANEAAQPTLPDCKSGANPAQSSAQCSTPGERTDTGKIDDAQVTPRTEQGELTFPDWTYRQYWGFRNGQWLLTLTSSRILARTNVFVSCSEVDANIVPFVGGARYTVHNVAPRAGSVTIRLNIEWPSPLRTQCSYLFVNP